MRARKASELDDGPTPRGPDAAGPNNEREGGLRTVGKNPALGPENEGALCAGLGLRDEAQEARAQGDLSGPGGAPAARAPQVHGQQGLRLRRPSLHRHGD